MHAVIVRVTIHNADRTRDVLNEPSCAQVSGAPVSRRRRTGRRCTRSLITIGGETRPASGSAAGAAPASRDVVQESSPPDEPISGRSPTQSSSDV